MSARSRPPCQSHSSGCRRARRARRRDEGVLRLPRRGRRRGRGTRLPSVPASTIRAPLSTKPVLEAEPTAAEPAIPVEDIRSARPYILSRRSLAALARRLLSVATLIAIDVGGVILGVYVALIFRAAYRGEWPPLWGLIWRTAEDWLPFLTVITVLVFWVGGLYRRREVRAGFGQVIKSLVLVAVITPALRIGTGYHFTTYGLTPTALVLTAVIIGVLRASYDVVTRDVLRLAGARRRAVLVGEGERLS